jgi:heme ABC exporter ATP-binding subunit CcmA
LRTEALSKQFGNLTVLRSLSVTVQPGEFLTIFGRNGAGKTTFLKIVAGLVRSYTGDVVLFGENLNSTGNAARRRVGFVSHETFLYPDLTVRENLLFHARLYRIPDASRVVDRAIGDMGLEAKAAVPVRTLSRGMKQRVSLSRAFLHQPELLLLDEPFTGLDERAAEVLDQALQTFKAGGGSVLMASHDIARGWKADRVAVLDRGGLACETTVAQTTQDEFRATYRDILLR